MLGRVRSRQLDAVAVGLLLVAVLCWATGWLPTEDAGTAARRAGPLLIFLAGVVVLAELVAAAEVFDVLSAALARLARGHAAGLFGLCLALATVVTVVLNLDTTAVLLTPVMLTLATRIGVPPLALAMTTLWPANTASLLLPVSNLTNLLAAGRVGLGAAGFAAVMWPAQLAALLVTGILLWFLFWRPALPDRRYRVPAWHRPEDPILCGWAAGCAVLFVAGVLADLPLPAVAVATAALAVIATAVRRRDRLNRQLLPWRLLVLITGLFGVVGALSVHGLTHLVAAAIGTDPAGWGPARAAGTGAVLANLINNLPAYLAGESGLPAGRTPILALLIGVNLGPVVMPWGSVATLLWFDRCRAAGVQVPVRRVILSGLLLAVLAIPAATASLR